MVNNKNLIGIVNSLLEGQVSIEQVWNDYGTYIRSINNCIHFSPLFVMPFMN